MKKLAAIACLTLLATGVFAQGFVNFLNGTATYVSVNSGGTIATASGAAGSYFYGLLVAPMGTTDPKSFNIALYGTNLATAGTVFGGNSKTVTGWAAGESRAYLVAGWNAGLGHDYNPAWMDPAYNGPAGFFGISAIKAGAAGGVDSNGATVPNLNVFGGNGITAGWVLNPIPIPEPTTMALAGLGAAAMLIFRRRK